MSITDEMRKYFDQCTYKAGVAPDEFDAVLITKSSALSMLDDIDAAFEAGHSRAVEYGKKIGCGTCHLEEIEKDCDTASEYMLDREWCFDAVYRCSCGCRFGHMAHNRPRFCPNCGAKVVDE